MIKRRTTKSIEDQIRREWATIVAKSGCNPLRSLAALPKGRLELLGSSLKTELGAGFGILTGVQYLAPADGSGVNVCPNSTEACREGCLGDHAGRMPMIRTSMQWKTTLRLGSRVLYEGLMQRCIERLQARAFKQGKAAAVRMDGTSDLGDAERFAYSYPQVTFYEYTKSLPRARRWARGRESNLSATLSYSGENRLDCIEHLMAGGNVAVPFDMGKGGKLPEYWNGYPVIDGDVHDFRAHDPAGSVVGLRWKGPKRTRDEARANGWFA